MELRDWSSDVCSSDLAEYESIDESKGRRKRRKKVKYAHSSTNITEDDQTMLWDLEHNATEHVPGKLYRDACNDQIQYCN